MKKTTQTAWFVPTIFFLLGVHCTLENMDAAGALSFPRLSSFLLLIALAGGIIAFDKIINYWETGVQRSASVRFARAVKSGIVFQCILAGALINFVGSDPIFKEGFLSHVLLVVGVLTAIFLFLWTLAGSEDFDMLPLLTSAFGPPLAMMLLELLSLHTSLGFGISFGIFFAIIAFTGVINQLLVEGKFEDQRIVAHI